MDAKLTPVPIPGAQKSMSTPSDAMQAGIHSDIRTSSSHKKQVSGVLHLKKEAAGHRSNPTAYNSGKKAFKPSGTKI